MEELVRDIDQKTGNAGTGLEEKQINEEFCLKEAKWDNKEN